MGTKRHGVKPKKPRYFIIDTGAFKHDIMVCLYAKSKDVKRFMKKYKMPELSEIFARAIDEKEEGTALFLRHSSGQRMICMWPKDARQKITLFTHEGTHAIYDIMERIGIRLNRHTEEAFAYTFEHIMDQFLRKA